MIECRLKEIIKARGLTAKDVHASTGISQNTLTLLGNGATKGIQFDTLSKLCNALSCEPNDILKLKLDEPKDRWLHFNLGKILEAKHLDASQVSKATEIDRVFLVKLINNSVNTIQLETLSKLCNYLQCDLSEIAEMSNKKEPAATDSAE